jgi:hypothetical protein
MVSMDGIKNFLITLLQAFRSWSVILYSLLLGIFLYTVMLMYTYFSGGNLATIGVPTAHLDIISGATATVWVPTEMPTPTLTPTVSIRPSPLPGIIGLDTLVQIFGTSGSGLNIRSQAGLSTGIEFLAYDTEVFSVKDGPIEADGILWWYLVTPVNAERAGWAAANYLSLVSQP